MEELALSFNGGGKPKAQRKKRSGKKATNGAKPEQEQQVEEPEGEEKGLFDRIKDAF